jgi:hypothetical protein
MSIESKAATCREHFEDWSKRRVAYGAALSDVGLVPEEAFTKTAQNFLAVQHEILNFFIESSGVRDEWESPTYLLANHGQQIERRSAKQEERYAFGVYSGDFLLQTNVCHPENLKYVTVEFWDAMTEGEQFGKFSFQENAGVIVRNGYGPKPELTKGGRSNIYKMIRNTLVLEQWGPESLCDLGWYEVTWPFETDWEELLVRGTQAFRCLHRMNYLLYRVEYQRRQRRSQRKQRET